MVNDDILIKVVRSRGNRFNWPDHVNLMKSRLIEMKLGFPGIGNDHLTIYEFKDIKEGDIFIYDPYIEVGGFGYVEEAPIMLRVINESECLIEGIGIGLDKLRDPDRLLYRWNDIIKRPNIPDNFLVYKVDSRPDLNGGSSYYYFFKSYRDFRL